jgi:hypothetical protein
VSEAREKLAARRVGSKVLDVRYTQQSRPRQGPHASDVAKLGPPLGFDLHSSTHWSLSDRATSRKPCFGHAPVPPTLLTDRCPKFVCLFSI